MCVQGDERLRHENAEVTRVKEKTLIGNHVQ
jgi:hypothetical protein